MHPDSQHQSVFGMGLRSLGLDMISVGIKFFWLKDPSRINHLHIANPFGMEPWGIYGEKHLSDCTPSTPLTWVEGKEAHSPRVLRGGVGSSAADSQLLV